MTHLEFTATYGHIMGASRALDVRERLTDLDSQAPFEEIHLDVSSYGSHGPNVSPLQQLLHPLQRRLARRTRVWWLVLFLFWGGRSGSREAGRGTALKAMKTTCKAKGGMSWRPLTVLSITKDL
eukprot:g510.t1